MRRLTASMVVGLALLALGGLAGPAAAVDNFTAKLSGSEEVPPVETRGTGAAVFQHRDSGLLFRLNVANLEDILFAHIHCGTKGANGPVGVTLFTGGPVTVNGTLAQGTIDAPDTDNQCGWADLGDVVTALESGDTYTNVHTRFRPGGEIRGQIS